MKTHYHSAIEPREKVALEQHKAGSSIPCSLLCNTRYRVALTLADTERLRDSLTAVLAAHKNIT